jgi:hypothetical protein
MSIGRPAIIAAQAVVVGVLIVVVYLTLLKPEDEAGTLTGVTTPGGTRVAQQPANPGPEGGRDAKRGGEASDEGGSAGGALVGSAFVPGTAGAAVGTLPVAPGAPVTPPAPVTPVAPVAPGVPPSGGTEAEPESPDSDQYSDAVSRLTEQLR